jgi:hypothetical protein
MKLQQCLSATVFLTIVEVVLVHSIAKAQQKAIVTRPIENSEFSAELANRRMLKHASPLQQTHKDVMSILGTNNACSSFFGGPHATDEVLSRLVAQLQNHMLQNSRIGIEMSGPFTYYALADDQLEYRLFVQATINTGGPFCKAKVFPAEPYVPRVGSFQPNTREARTLILLHELAHLVRMRNGSWLIPDDGNMPALSAQNTALIETQCRQQILSLGEKDNKVVWH